MNIQHLKAFVLAAHLGSISAAAREMGKRQSQVSQWIADLEVDFGGRAVCPYRQQYSP